MKSLIWVASSKKDLLDMPDDVQDLFGFALYQAQAGRRHERAKPLKGFGSAGVLEIVDDWMGDTYRAVYTVKFPEAIYVLHCFQKKSSRGAETPKPDMERIKERLKAVEAHSRGSRQ